MVLNNPPRRLAGESRCGTCMTTDCLHRLPTGWEAIRVSRFGRRSVGSSLRGALYGIVSQHPSIRVEVPCCQIEEAHIKLAYQSLEQTARALSGLPLGKYKACY